jgi:hypothetical protein
MQEFEGEGSGDDGDYDGDQGGDQGNDFEGGIVLWSISVVGDLPDWIGNLNNGWQKGASS